MGPTRKPETATQRALRLNPAVQNVTMMVTVLASGDAYGTVGVLDRTTRRYRFTRTRATTAHGVELRHALDVLVQLAVESATDAELAPF
jgi:hypothetical protein